MVSLSEFVLKVNFKNDNRTIDLNKIDPEDISHMLTKIQHSFDISFEQEDLNPIKNFAGLCDAVVKKMKVKQADGCSTQHAFYILRNAINLSVPADKDLIKPQTKLCNIFPRDTRLQVIAEIEKEMGFKMNLLKPKGMVVFIFSLMLGASVVGLFFWPVIAAVGLLLSIAGLILAGKFGKEMPVKTLGDLAEKISKEHYRNCRKNASTVNYNEVSEKLRELFIRELYMGSAAVAGGAKY